MKPENVVPEITPVGIDLFTTKFNATLLTKLTWLNKAYGKCLVHRQKTDKGISTIPIVYAGSKQTGDYISVFPDDRIGNHVFWIFSDPINYKYHSAQQSSIDTQCSIVIWFDLRKIANSGFNNIEFVKTRIIEAIRAANRSVRGEFQWTAINERPQSIYREFSFTDMDAKFTTHPYFAYRFDGRLKMHEECLPT
jgi:hypothetical protein